MAQANDSFTRAADGTGTLLATQSPGDGKEYPVTMLAEADGHIQGTKPAFGFQIPPSAVGAGKVYFDLFNAQAGSTINIRHLFAIVATDVAVTGVLGVRLDTFRTTAVGTGGTAFGADTAATTTPSIFKFDPSQAALPAGITGRAVPTAGATTGTFLWPSYVYGEETATQAQMSQYFNLIPEMPFHQPIALTNGFGLKVVQGTVASVGNVGFLGTFTVE